MRTRRIARNRSRLAGEFHLRCRRCSCVRCGVAREPLHANHGLRDFNKVPCGKWNITVIKDGFQNANRTVEIASGGNVEVNVVLSLKMKVESVEVTDSVAPVEQSGSENNVLRPVEVTTLPTNPATVTDTLPLVPGVVRTADGELKIDGAGQERSAMVVNQSDITDPATGRFGQTIPVDSIETVNVLTTPFLAQYGRFTQTVVAVETKRGGEKWHAELKDPFPDFRIPVITCAEFETRRRGSWSVGRWFAISCTSSPRFNMFSRRYRAVRFPFRTTNRSRSRSTDLHSSTTRSQRGSY